MKSFSLHFTPSFFFVLIRWNRHNATVEHLITLCARCMYKHKHTSTICTHDATEFNVKFTKATACHTNCTYPLTMFLCGTRLKNAQWKRRENGVQFCKGVFYSSWDKSSRETWTAFTNCDIIYTSSVIFSDDTWCLSVSTAIGKVCWDRTVNFHLFWKGKET